MNKIIPIMTFINLQEDIREVRKALSENDNNVIELYKVSVIIEKGINRIKNKKKAINTTNISLEIVE